ncbi:MAG: hypothetical protein ACOC8K_05770 [Gemmatimonadota bacterium]
MLVTPGRPIRFVGTYTEEFVDGESWLLQTLGSLSSNRMVRRLRVDPFDPDETREGRISLDVDEEPI